MFHLCGMCRYRAAFLLGCLLGVVLADVGCVKRVRTANDNFYVINRKTASTKLPPTDPQPVLAHANPELSDSATEALKAQANGGLRAKSSLSNVAILEEDNSRISSLLRKAQSDPSNASVQYELGRAYYDFRLYDEALRYYQNALQLEQKPVYYEQMGRLWRDWGLLQKGADSVKKALELDPNFVEAWNTLGTIFDRQGSFDHAQEAYLHALALDSDLDYVHNNLCFSYLQSGKIEQAVADGERATHLNPTLQIAHTNLAIAYGIQGDLDRSFAEFKLSGDEAVARNNLGLILLKRGQITESMEQFKLAARMKPYYEEAAENYRRARDLNFQRVREARFRLRSFDHETAMEAAPTAFGLVAIENVGLGLLGGMWELLSLQALPVYPSRGSLY